MYFPLIHYKFHSYINFINPYDKEAVHICYSPAGRSILGETVPEVLSTKTSGTVSLNMD